MPSKYSKLPNHRPWAYVLALLWRILEPKQIQDFSGRLVVETAVMLIRVSDVEQDRGRGRKSGNSYIVRFLSFYKEQLVFC